MERKHLNDEQLLRYSRQIMLPEIDIEGQEKLLAARVLIVGLGGLGSPAALYLAAAGVGCLTLADDDRVELSNLQRQILHRSNSVGELKTQSAEQTLVNLNPDTELQLISQRLEGQVLQSAVMAADLVLDGSDNFATRHALNRACWESRTPLVSGAAIRLEGQVSVFDPRDSHSPCYACFYSPRSEPPLSDPPGSGPSGSDVATATEDVVTQDSLNCAENGVAAPLVGIIGSIQAMEAMKVITGCGEPLVGQVLYLDATRMEFRSLKLNRDPGCPVCGSPE